MSPLDAYFHLRGILEHTNAIIGELFASDVMKKIVEKEELEKE